MIARALRGLTTERPLVATKGGHWRRCDSFPVDGRPGTLRAHCEISLRALEVNRIDLYQLHHVDPQVPLPESVGALGQLWQEGEIAAIGLSNVTVAQLDEALAVAPIAAVQNRLSYRDPDDLPMALACAKRDVAYLAYSPFGGLAGLIPQPVLGVACPRLGRPARPHRFRSRGSRHRSRLPVIVRSRGAGRAARHRGRPS